MNILLKGVTVLDKNSKYHNKKTNIHIVNGKIKELGKVKADAKSQIIEGKDLFVSPGWLDIGTRLTEPGQENLDDLGTLSRSATKGGFTGLAVFPNTNPVVDNKSVVSSILSKASKSITDIYPIAAITNSNNGMELAEMVDLYKHGAVAFSDGKIPLAHAGVLSRALNYSSNLPTPIINHPEDMTISESGILNEGKLSVYLGMKGRPAIAEIAMLQRDILLCEYNDAKIISHMISTGDSVKLIKAAKRKKLKINSTVSYHNLVADEESLKEFDSMHKVIPPLRTKKDNNALIKGLLDDSIDAIVSNHYPLDIEDKRKAFFDTKYGAIGLENMFSTLNTKIGKKVPLEIIIDKISNKPREILGLDKVTIAKGEKANLTIFSPSEEFNFKEEDIKSKSTNSPFVGQKFMGKVIGIINKGMVEIV